MNAKKEFQLLTIFVCVIFIYIKNPPAYSQNQAIISNSQIDNINIRIGRQEARINSALSQGSLLPQQSQMLKANLREISREAGRMRRQNGGLLSHAQYNQLDGELRQNLDNLNTHTDSNRRTRQSATVLGPRWAGGQDGAQDPRKLRQQMKVQEKRQLQQYEQSMQQTQELQQQEYEKQMLQKLGQQRPDILQNKQDIQQTRKDTGAN